MRFNFLAISSGNIVDIVILAVFLIFFIVGFSKGFIGTLFKFFARIISLLIAFLLCAKFVAFANDKFSVIPFFSKKIEGVLPKVFGETLMNTSLNDIASDESIVTGAKGLSSLIVKLVLSLVADTEGIDKSITLSQVLAPSFSYYICLILGFIILYIIVRILFFLISKLLGGMASKAKILSGIDKLFGGLLGIIEGFFLIYIVIFVLGVIPLTFTANIVTAITVSKIGAFISSINIFDYLSKAISSFDYIKEYITGKFPA